MTYRKKLIEVALPLDAINKASAREKSIRHGHPSTLHLWWARRPLAAARAVIFAQMVDDPSAHLKGKREDGPGLFAKETKRIEQLAMQEVTETEKSLKYEPRDVSQENCGYDIESARKTSGKLRFIEVKGRIEGAKTVTVTKNEILTALNKPEDFILAIVLVPPPEDGKAVDPWQIQDLERPYGPAPNGCRVHYIRKPFSKEPDFNATSVNYKLDQLLASAEVPS